MVEGAHVSLRVPETRGRALGGGAKWRARVCQGGTLLTGAPAAASGRGAGNLAECAAPATAAAQASAEQEAGARIVRRRRCAGMLLVEGGGLEVGLPTEGRGQKKSTPPKRPRILPGATGC